MHDDLTQKADKKGNFYSNSKGVWSSYVSHRDGCDMDSDWSIFPAHTAQLVSAMYQQFRHMIN